MQIVIQVILDEITDKLRYRRAVRSYIFRAELGLCLAFELRFGELDRDDGSQAFADVVTGEVVVLVADDCPCRGRSG